MTPTERRVVYLMADLLRMIATPGYATLRDIEALQEQLNRARADLETEHAALTDPIGVSET